MHQGDTDEIRESVAAVLAEECGSLALHRHLDGQTDLSSTLWARASELGWLLVALPENRGGLGMGARGCSVLHYEIGRACAPGPFVATACALQVLGSSDDPAVHALIDRVVEGSTTLAVPAIPNGRNDVRGTSMRLLGSIDSAAALVPDGTGDLLLLDLASADRRDFAVWDGTRTLFDALAPDHVIARIAGAAPTLMGAMALALAADSAGLARGIADRTIDYLKTREQFGKPIGSFQALKHRAADLRARALVADHVVEHAAERLDADCAGGTAWAGLAKAEASEVAVFVSGDCIQLHGGVGFTQDYDPHIFAKRARLNEVLVAGNRDLRDAAFATYGAARGGAGEFMEIGA